MEVINVLNTVAFVAIGFVGYKIFKLQQEINATKRVLNELQVLEAEVDQLNMDAAIADVKIKLNNKSVGIDLQ
jgi:hypothetical protein